MKKHLLTFGLLAFGFTSFAQFTPGNLLVLQAGDDATTETNGMTIHLKELTKAGNFVQKISVASTGADAVVFGTPGATTEGLPTLSADRQFLTFMGYNATAGTSGLSGSSTTTVKRTVVTFKADGTYTLAKFSVFSGQSPRTVVTNNGTDFWMGGGSNGMRYGTTADLSTTTSLFSAPSGYRSVGIFNNELYFSTTNSGSPNPDVRMGKVSGALPTAATTYISLPGLPTTTIVPHAFVLFDTDNIAGPDLLYLGTDDGLQKYHLNAGTWVDDGLFSTGAGSVLKGITGFIVTGQTNVTIFGIIGANVGNKLVSIVDNGGFTSSISATRTDLLTAPAGAAFKGVTFTPGTTQTVLPVDLKSFDGRQQSQSVRLDWATASESNNSHFNVLRANDSKQFQAIGKVEGNGNSNTLQKYAFVDANPFAGNNYYQLQQVDFNGNSEKSEVVVVKTDIKDKTLSIRQNAEQLEVNIHAYDAAKAQFYISNVSGQKIFDTSIQLSAGYTQKSIDISKFNAGVYIATVVIDGSKHAIKFIR
ncbi:T9SS type A sorting domain-containing protein [Pedobacter sp.]